MEWLKDLLPVWVPLVILIAILIAAIGFTIFIKVTETHEEPPLPVERAIPVGTFRIWVDIDLLPSDEKALLIGKKIRTELTTLLKSRLWLRGSPHITLRSDLSRIAGLRVRHLHRRHGRSGGDAQGL